MEDGNAGGKGDDDAGDDDAGGDGGPAGNGRIPRTDDGERGKEDGDPPLPAGFTRMATLGSGTYGAVYLVRDDRARRRRSAAGTGNGGDAVAGSATAAARPLWALKVQRPGEDGWGTFLREVDCMTALRGHPHVARACEVGISGHLFWILMPRYAGDLAWFIATRPRGERWAALPRVAQQLASALAALHALGIAHRDVKPANVLLEEDDVADAGGDGTGGTGGGEGEPRGPRVRLCDFGMAKDMRGGFHSPTVVTLPYRPPEVMMGSKIYGPKVDVWSYGMVLLEMLRGKRALRADGNEQDALCAASRFLARMKAGGIESVLRDDGVQPDELGERCRHAVPLVRRALRADPLRRPAFADLLARHPLFRGLPPVPTAAARPSDAFDEPRGTDDTSGSTSTSTSTSTAAAEDAASPPRQRGRTGAGSEVDAENDRTLARARYRALRRIARAAKRDEMLKLTFVLAADLADSHASRFGIAPASWAELAAGCLFLAASYHERHPPDAEYVERIVGDARNAGAEAIEAAARVVLRGRGFRVTSERMHPRPEDLPGLSWRQILARVLIRAASPPSESNP